MVICWCHYWNVCFYPNIPWEKHKTTSPFVGDHWNTHHWNMPSVDRIIRVMTIKWVASTRSVVTSPLIQHVCNGKHPTNSKKEKQSVCGKWKGLAWMLLKDLWKSVACNFGFSTSRSWKNKHLRSPIPVLAALRLKRLSTVHSTPGYRLTWKLLPRSS